MFQSKQLNSSLHKSLVSSDYYFKSRYGVCVFFGGIDLPDEMDIRKELTEDWDTQYQNGYNQTRLYEALARLGAVELGTCYSTQVPEVDTNVSDRVEVKANQGGFVHAASGEAKFVLIFSNYYVETYRHNNTGGFFQLFASVGNIGSGADIEFPNGVDISPTNPMPFPGLYLQDSEDNLPIVSVEKKPIRLIESTFTNIQGFTNLKVMSEDYFTKSAVFNMDAALDQTFEFEVLESFDLVLRGRINVDSFELIRKTDGVTIPMALTNLDQMRVGLYPDIYVLKSLGNNTLTEFRAEPLSDGYGIALPIDPVSVQLIGPTELAENSSTMFSMLVTDSESNEIPLTQYNVFTSNHPEVTIEGNNVVVGQNIVGDTEEVELYIEFKSNGKIVSDTKTLPITDNFIASYPWSVLEESTWTLGLKDPTMSDGSTSGSYTQYYTNNYSIIEVTGPTVFGIWVSLDSRYDDDLNITDELNGGTLPMGLVAGNNEIFLDKGIYRIEYTGNTLIYEFKEIYYDKLIFTEPMFGNFVPVSLEATVASSFTEYESTTYAVEAVAADDSRRLMPMDSITVDSADITLTDLTRLSAKLVNDGLTLDEDLSFDITSTMTYEGEVLTAVDTVVVTNLAYRPAVVDISDSAFTTAWGNPDDGRLTNGVTNVHSETECIQLSAGTYFSFVTDSETLIDVTALTEVDDLIVHRLSDDTKFTLVLADGVTTQLALPLGGYRIYGTGVTTLAEFNPVTYAGEALAIPYANNPTLNSVLSNDHAGNNYYTLSSQSPLAYDEDLLEGWTYMEFDMNTNSYTPEACGPAVFADGVVNYWHYGRGTYPFNAGQRIGLLVKMPEGLIWASKNGVWENNGDPELYSREGQGGNPVASIPSMEGKSVRFGSNSGTGGSSQYSIFNGITNFEMLYTPTLG